MLWPSPRPDRRMPPLPSLPRRLRLDDRDHPLGWQAPDGYDARVPPRRGALCWESAPPAPNSGAPWWPAPESALWHGGALDLARALPDACADFCYLDPPFFSGKERRGRDELAFDDAGTDLIGYLTDLLALLAELRRLLRPSGNLVLHLDWHAAHRLKVELDLLFGVGALQGERAPGFRNEIVWLYGTGGRARRSLSRKHDLLLWYSRGKDWHFDPAGFSAPRTRCKLCGAERERWNHMKRERDEQGRVFRSIHSGTRRYRYYDDEAAPPIDVFADLWADLPALQQRDPERNGWPTQKPLPLLERLVALFCPDGGLVLDPMCGSGTTLSAATRLGRAGLGIERDPRAITLAARRFEAEHPGVTLHRGHWRAESTSPPVPGEHHAGDHLADGQRGRGRR